MELDCCQEANTAAEIEPLSSACHSGPDRARKTQAKHAVSPGAEINDVTVRTLGKASRIPINLENWLWLAALGASSDA
jgi:hypothetical protein